MAKKKATAIKIPSEKDIMKKYKGSGIAEVVLEDVELWLPSRFLALNDLFGGGAPYGKIIEIYGEESSGKSLLAYDFAYCAQQLGGVVIWVDVEQSYKKKWAEKNGVDNSKVMIYAETAVENVSDFIRDSCLYWRSKLTNNEPILLVVDSIAGLDCLDNINSSQVDGKAEMGNRAKANDRMIRTRNELLSDLGICSIFINQVRSNLKVGLFGDPETTPGGKALAFYASIRCGVYGGKQIKAKMKGIEERVGKHSTIRIKKNKVAPPKPSLKAAEVYFVDNYKSIGFNRYFGFPSILLKEEVLQKKGSRYYLKEKMIANGEEALIKIIEEDDKLRSKLIRRSSVNTISKTQATIDKFKENLFPVDFNKNYDEEE